MFKKHLVGVVVGISILVVARSASAFPNTCCQFSGMPATCTTNPGAGVCDATMGDVLHQRKLCDGNSGLCVNDLDKAPALTHVGVGVSLVLLVGTGCMMVRRLNRARAA